MTKETALHACSGEKDRQAVSRAFFWYLGAPMVAVGLATHASAEGFDMDTTGAPPADCVCGVTGGGVPRWTVEADFSAPSKPNVLIQSGNGRFPWCVKNGSSLTDGFVEVKFKPIEGHEDQAGGVVWHWKDQNDYLIARANALENNVSLYYMERGRRNTIKYVDAPVPRGKWSTLRAEYTGKRIRITLNGKAYIDLEDDHLAGSGLVGVWTKADSVTAFDDLFFGQIP